MSNELERYQHVSDLMDRQAIDIDALANWSGLERRVAEAIAFQRYTPSPTQRERVSSVLGVPKDRVVWGHATVVDAEIHQPI